eukprot:6616855-Prymnesium_polylepis.2
MKDRLELDDSTACENGDRYDTRTCGGRVVALRDCQWRAVHGVYLACWSRWFQRYVPRSHTI